jgi:hypothetical protein
MRKTVLCSIVCTAALILGAAGLRGQVKLTGYLSGEYLKGQSESNFALGYFQNIQAGGIATGVVSQKFTFTLEARALTSDTSDLPGPRFEIEQALVGFAPSEAFSIKAGLFLVPFGVWNQASRPYESILVGTPLNLQYLYPQSWRDLGLLVDGKFGIFSYSGYLANGLKLKEADSLSAGQQFTDNNKDKAKGGRLGLNFSQEIQAGVSYYTGKYDDLDERNLTLEGAHLSWITNEWQVRAEATKGIIKNPEPFADGKCEGYSVWLVMSIAHLQPVGSFQKVKYEDPYHGEGISVDLRRWTAGVRFTMGTSLYLKAEYEWNLETPKVKNDLVRVQAALSF